MEVDPAVRLRPPTGDAPRYAVNVLRQPKEDPRRLIGDDGLGALVHLGALRLVEFGLGGIKQAIDLRVGEAGGVAAPARAQRRYYDVGRVEGAVAPGGE